MKVPICSHTKLNPILEVLYQTPYVYTSYDKWLPVKIIESLYFNVKRRSINQLFMKDRLSLIRIRSYVIEFRYVFKVTRKFTQIDRDITTDIGRCISRSPGTDSYLVLCFPLDFVSNYTITNRDLRNTKETVLNSV